MAEPFDARFSQQGAPDAQQMVGQQAYAGQQVPAQQMFAQQAQVINPIAQAQPVQQGQAAYAGRQMPQGFQFQQQAIRQEQQAQPVRLPWPFRRSW